MDCSGFVDCGGFMDCGGSATAFTRAERAPNTNTPRLRNRPSASIRVHPWFKILPLIPVLLLLLLLSSHSVTVTAATTVTVPTKNPDYVALFNQFDASFNNGEAYSNTDNTSGSLGWGQGYFQLAYIQMYRATSDTQYLDKLVTQFDRVLTRRDDKLKRADFYAKKPLKAWGCSNYDKQGRWHVFVVHTGMICKGPAEFVRTVKSDPALTTRYGATADRYLDELEAVVADANRDYRTSGTMGYFTDPSVGEGGIVPLNMSNAMGAVIVELYRITKKPQYKEQAAQLASFFRASLHSASDHAWVWSYWPKNPGDSVTRGEDISHAAVNVDFAARCYHAGIVFSQADMEKFAGTWMTVVRKQIRPITYADFIDGTEKPELNYVPQAAGRWLPLITCITPHMRRLYLAAIEPAFAGQEITWPSQGLGLAYLARFTGHRE
jgi:hypothetical protein